MKRFVGKQGEGVGFLGVFGNAETRRGKDFDAWKHGGKLSEDHRIMRTTSGNDELANICFGQHETVQRINHGERGKNCRRADEIVGLGAIASPEGEKFC